MTSSPADHGWSTSARATATAVVLHDVSVEIGEGEFFTLLGPSGSGKSTLLRIIAGLLDADGGEVVIGGPQHDGPPGAHA